MTVPVLIELTKTGEIIVAYVSEDIFLGIYTQEICLNQNDHHCHVGTPLSVRGVVKYHFIPSLCKLVSSINNCDFYL